MFKMAILSCLAVALSGCMPPCGSTTNPTSYNHYISVEGATISVYNAPDRMNLLEPLPSQGAINANDFVITLSTKAEKESSSGAQSSHASIRFGLFKRAHACSPAQSSSEQSQRLTRLNITSDQDFNDFYPAGTSLNPLFQIETMGFDSVYGMEIDDIFQSRGGEIDLYKHLELRLTEAPTVNKLHNFRVEINDEPAVILSGVKFNEK